MTQTLLDDAAVDAFLAAPAVGPSIDWDAPPPAPPTPKPADPYSWDDVDPGPSESDPSWAAFGAAAADAADASSGTKKKLSAAEREKARDEQMLRDARESIRKRGWSEGEVKWRAWLATRGHDVQVNDWNLHKYVDGECIPPSRDPFWLNANEKELLDYEAGNKQRVQRYLRALQAVESGQTEVATWELGKEEGEEGGGVGGPSEDEPYNPDFNDVERVVGMQPQTEDLPPVYLVKWRGLPYASCTWESARTLLHEQTAIRRYLALETPRYAVDELSAALETITLRDVSDFQQALLPDALLETLLIGNFDEKEALGIVDAVTAALPARAPLAADQIPRRKTRVLAPGRALRQTAWPRSRSTASSVARTSTVSPPCADSVSRSASAASA